MYGVELRQKVLEILDRQNWSCQKAADFFSISLRTIQRWVEMSRQGSVKPRQCKTRMRKVEAEAFREHIAHHPDATLEELGQVFDIRPSSVWYQLKKLKITLKKKPRSTKNAVKKTGKNFEKL